MICNPTALGIQSFEPREDTHSELLARLYRERQNLYHKKRYQRLKAEGRLWQKTVKKADGAMSMRPSGGRP